MHKKLIAIFLLFTVLSACAAEENAAPPSMLSPVEGKYIVLLLFEENTSQQQVSEVSDAVLGAAQDAGVLQEAVISMRPDEYGIEPEGYPAIVIIDSKEIVLETKDAEEAAAFLKKAL